MRICHRNRDMYSYIILHYIIPTVFTDTSILYLRYKVSSYAKESFRYFFIV